MTLQKYGLVLVGFVAVLAFSPGAPSLDAADGDNAGEVTQTCEELAQFGPGGARVIIAAACFDSHENKSITSIGPGVIPVGGMFTLEIPRTIRADSMPVGHGKEARGKWLRVVDATTCASSNIDCAANNGRSYYAYPNAVDYLGNDMALREILLFQRTSTGWQLIQLPEGRTGYTPGEPATVPGTNSRRGFAWRIHADGTCRISNGTVVLQPDSVGSGSGDGGPRFRGEFQFPFRLEQHVGNHRNFQFGISTKRTEVPFAALSVPRNSGTGVDGMTVTVYIAEDAQPALDAEDRVNITIGGDGNWKLLGTPGE